jgi:hypothetical protein
MLQGFQRNTVRPGDDLGQAVMVAKVDEQDSAMIALAVDPARQPNLLADIKGAKRTAMMSPVCVHSPPFEPIFD